MEIAAYIALVLATIALYTVTKLAWLWYRLRFHPHVERVEVAFPAIAHELNALVAEVATAAGVSAPALYIRRAALPNAFIVATIIRPELYLTDELLEDCDNRPDGMNHLIHTVCHEIAHIKRGDAIKLCFLTWLMHLTSALCLPSLANTFREQIGSLELDTDIEANHLAGMLAEDMSSA